MLLSAPLAALIVTAVPGTGPIRLKTQPIADGVELLVVGVSSAPVGAGYSLEVTAGSNSSWQSGTVDLRPGEPVTVVRLRLTGQAAQQWKAQLVVKLADGSSYSQEHHGG